MPELAGIDLAELATALQDQGQSFYGQLWLVDRQTGELRLWMEDIRGPRVSGVVSSTSPRRCIRISTPT